MFESTALQAYAAAILQPVTVEIPGITKAAQFTRLADAAGAVWATLKALPLDYETLAAYELLFGPGADPQRVQDFLDRNGELTLSFAMAGKSHVVRVRLVEAGAAR